MYLTKLHEVTSLFFKTACKDVLISRLIKVLTSSLSQKFDVSAEEKVPKNNLFSSQYPENKSEHKFQDLSINSNLPFCNTQVHGISMTVQIRHFTSACTILQNSLVLMCNKNWYFFANKLGLPNKTSH